MVTDSHGLTPHFTDSGFSPKSSRSLSKSHRQSDPTHTASPIMHHRHRGISRLQTHPLTASLTISHSHISPSLPTVQLTRLMTLTHRHRGISRLTLTASLTVSHSHVSISPSWPVTQSSMVTRLTTHGTTLTPHRHYGYH
jgi:hypothetical protein